LEGLEISEILFSILTKKNERFRIDSEFVKKEYLKTELLLEKREHKYLNEINAKIIHPTEIKREFVEEGVWFFRTQNLRPLRIEDSNNVFISKEDSKRLIKNEIKKNDILLTRTGANFGQCAIYKKECLTIGSSHVLIIRNTYFNQSYLAAFFNTKYGRLMINKGMYGGLQPEVAPYYLFNIPIPCLSKYFQNKIGWLVDQSANLEKYYQQTYTQAENLLLETLSLKDFKPIRGKINIKSFSNSFRETGRLDAEYYQPKYEQIVTQIKKVKNSVLEDVVNIKKSIEPGSDAYSDEGIPFLRVADYNKFGISTPQKCLSDSYYQENKKTLEKLKPKANTILFSKDGSVGTAYKLRQDENLITSGAILHLIIRNNNEILPDYLTLVLNSKLVQMQAERDAGGSIILHWRVNEIGNVLLPVIDFSIQKEISELIEKSFLLKKQSEQLLEIVKIAVEKAIETNEKLAETFINEQLENLNLNGE